MNAVARDLGVIIVDMGRTECFVSDTGRSYGEKLGEWLNAYGDWLTETLNLSFSQPPSGRLIF